MTFKLRVTITCDAGPERCPNTFTSLPGVGTVGEARADARVLRWSHRVIPRRGGGPARSCDFCPEHPNAEPREEP